MTIHNFSSSVAVALQSVGHSMPAGWAVLPTLDVDAVVSSLELSLKLPDPVCLDPRVAPSQGVVHHRNVGDELHMVFECSFLQPLRVQYANLFSNNIQTMPQFFSQEDFGGILSFVSSCLTLLDV